MTPGCRRPSREGKSPHPATIAWRGWSWSRDASDHERAGPARNAGPAFFFTAENAENAERKTRGFSTRFGLGVNAF